MSVCSSLCLHAYSINRVHSSLSVFYLTQTCSPSALVLGASEAGPGLFVVWPVQGPAKSGKRPVQGSVPSGTRPFGRSATTACDCSGLHLTPCFLLVPLLGSNRSAPSAGTFSARVPSARSQRLGPLGLRHPRIGPLGSNPSSSRRPRSPAGLGWFAFATPMRFACSSLSNLCNAFIYFVHALPYSCYIHTN